MCSYFKPMDICVLLEIEIKTITCKNCERSIWGQWSVRRSEFETGNLAKLNNYAKNEVRTEVYKLSEQLQSTINIFEDFETNLIVIYLKTIQIIC